MHTYLQVINGSFVIGNFPNSLWVTLNFMPRKASCHSIEWPEVFAQVGLFFLFFVCIDYALYTHTHTHTLTLTHSHTHLWVLIHLLAICPGDLPWGRWAVALTLFLFPFLCCILFVPLLMEVAQENVGFLCYNNLFRRVFTCWKVNRRPSIRCFTNRVCMKPAEVALIVDRKSFQEISLLHGNGWNLQRRVADLWLGVCCRVRYG